MIQKTKKLLFYIESNKK